MGISDARKRIQSAPFYADVWGYNRNDQSEVDVRQYTNPGDLDGLLHAPVVQNPIRFHKPFYGQFSEATLFAKIQIQDATNGVKFAIGNFQPGSREPYPTIAQSTIDQHHKILTGYTQSIQTTLSGIITISGINLMPLIPQYGSPGYNQDAFILMTVFDSMPASGGSYHVSQFRVLASSQIGK